MILSPVKAYWPTYRPWDTSTRERKKHISGWHRTRTVLQKEWNHKNKSSAFLKEFKTACYITILDVVARFLFFFFFFVIYHHSCFVPHWQELVMFGPERPVMSESAFFCFPSHGRAEQLKSNPSFCIAFSCTFWETERLESPPGCFAWASPEAYVCMLKNQNHIVTKSRLQWGNQAGVSANGRCAASLRGEVKTRCTEVWVNSIAADEMAPASMRALHTHELFHALCVFFTHTRAADVLPLETHLPKRAIEKRKGGHRSGYIIYIIQ